MAPYKSSTQHQRREKSNRLTKVREQQQRRQSTWRSSSSTRELILLVGKRGGRMAGRQRSCACSSASGSQAYCKPVNPLSQTPARSPELCKGHRQSYQNRILALLVLQKSACLKERGSTLTGSMTAQKRFCQLSLALLVVAPLSANCTHVCWSTGG